MPEGSRDAAILIAISYQALNRQLVAGDPRTQKANCTVTILFAGFYIEATIDYIVAEMNVRSQMMDFLNPSNSANYHPGIQSKLGWFYNKFTATKKAANKGQFSQLNIYGKIRRKFPGFAKLYKFRNDVSHGKINGIADSLPETQALRAQAKAIRNSLYAIALRYDPGINIDTTYSDAITS
jgi:hypothetical protein